MTVATDYLEHIAIRRNKLREELASLLPLRGRFVFEIGCGHGHFLTSYATQFPEDNCVGIDIALDRVQRARKKRDRAKLSHLHFIRADARDFLATMPPEACFSAIYILFPDPWPKRRHHKNRLLEPNFLHALALRAAPGTRLYFRTDFEPYFKEAEQTVASHPDWKLLPPKPWPFDAPTVFQRKAKFHHSLTAEKR